MFLYIIKKYSLIDYTNSKECDFLKGSENGHLNFCFEHVGCIKFAITFVECFDNQHFLNESQGMHIFITICVGIVMRI